MIRSLFFAMILLATSSSWALGPLSSWDQIFRTQNIQLIIQEQLGRLQLKHICLTEAYLQTREPVTYCSELKPVGKGENKDKFTDWVCKQWIFGIYRYPRQTAMGFVGDEVQVQVRVGDNTPQAYRFFKNYFFPRCK